MSKQIHSLITIYLESNNSTAKKNKSTPKMLEPNAIRAKHFRIIRSTNPNRLNHDGTSKEQFKCNTGDDRDRSRSMHPQERNQKASDGTKGSFFWGERSSLCGGSTDSGGHGDPRGSQIRLGRSEDEGHLRWKGHSESHVFASYSFSPPSPISSIFLSQPSLLFRRSRRRRGGCAAFVSSFWCYSCSYARLNLQNHPSSYSRHLIDHIAFLSHAIRVMSAVSRHI